MIPCYERIDSALAGNSAAASSALRLPYLSSSMVVLRLYSTSPLPVGSGGSIGVASTAI